MSYQPKRQGEQVCKSGNRSNSYISSSLAYFVYHKEYDARSND